MPSAILIELQYLPPVASLAVMTQAGELWLEACENYSKGSWRNRCLIAGANGPQILSIPLRKGKNRQMPIQQVRIAYDEDWQAQHWQTLRSAYGRAPFFEHFAPEMEPLYHTRIETLWEWNLQLLRVLYNCFGLRPNWQLTQSWQEQAPAGIVDLRNAIHPKKPLPPSIAVPGPYPQVFEDKHGFLPNLSSLDLLMCQGRWH